ncbi:MAG TPA: hypothetical protein VF575_03530 [Candidatus Saccharimonadales bacterium]|jgi:hypothetical protein
MFGFALWQIIVIALVTAVAIWLATWPSLIKLLGFPLMYLVTRLFSITPPFQSWLWLIWIVAAICVVFGKWPKLTRTLMIMLVVVCLLSLIWLGVSRGSRDESTAPATTNTQEYCKPFVQAVGKAKQTDQAARTAQSYTPDGTEAALKAERTVRSTDAELKKELIALGSHPECLKDYPWPKVIFSAIAVEGGLTVTFDVSDSIGDDMTYEVLTKDISAKTLRLTDEDPIGSYTYTDPGQYEPEVYGTDVYGRQVGASQHIAVAGN